ncbi:MAG: carboxypeptidase-like regulatory domain-containing protein, partial [bacterium]|nr:carboxypeptidase-like regulatory domain-containing protein [bacterium]
MKLKLLLPLVLVGIAQAKFIAGVVLDVATGSPVPGAEVTIQDESVQTDSRGEFRITFDGFGVLGVGAGERFAPYRRPVGRTERLTVALIPAVVRLGEVPVSLVDFIRDSSATSLADVDTRWRCRWDSPPRVYVEPDLNGALDAIREPLSGPRLPEIGSLEFTRAAEDELRADVIVRSAPVGSDLTPTYDPRSGRVVGGVVGIPSDGDSVELERVLSRALMRVYGFNPLGAGDARRPLTVLGDAPAFTRLDTMALAVAKRLPVDTDMSWYGHRLPLDLEARRNRVLALPFFLSYEDPYMSLIAVAEVEEALDDYGPDFRVVLHPDLVELAKLADEGQDVPERLIRKRAFGQAEAAEQAREAGCRYAFWGELTNSGMNSTTSFYAVDAQTGEFILALEGDVPDRLHFPRFLSAVGLALAQAIEPRDDVQTADGVLRLFFTSQHSSTYVHALVDDSLVAVLHEGAG